MKTIILSTSLLIGILAVGCSQSSDEPTTMGKTVEDQVKKTEASIDDTVSDMKAFSFEQKQAFSEGMNKQIVVIESEIQALESMLKDASDSVKTAAKPKLAALKERAAALKKKAAVIADATPSTWDGIKADSQKAYDALKESVNESRQWLSDAIQPTEKS